MKEIDKKILEFIKARDIKNWQYAAWLNIDLKLFYNRKIRARKCDGTPFDECDYVTILINYQSYLRGMVNQLLKQKPIAETQSTRNTLCSICNNYEISLKRAAKLMGLNYKTLLTGRRHYFGNGELNLLLGQLKNYFEKELIFISDELEKHIKAKRKVIRNKRLGKIK